VTLSKRAEGDVGTRAAGDYFGERSLQSTGPAIASATAATACELLRMERTALDRVLGLAALKLWSNTLAGAKTARGISTSLWRSAATARVSSRSLVAASEAAAAAATAATAAAAAAAAATALATVALESAAGGDEEPAPPFERLDDVPTLRDFIVSKRPIGAGGFGKVHCCCHKPSGRHFALKHMEKAQAVKLNATAAVLSESATLSMVLHPFVANKFCSLQTPSHLILVLEMCTGGDFYDVLKRDGHFQPAAVKVALCHLLLALEHLHGAGIVHRDLKPENLLLNDRGHTKLTDFGFAKSVRFRTFTLCGTPAYMAPEVVLQRGHGKAVDFWALGCVLLELLHGKSPFAAPHAHASYQLTLQGTVTYPETLPPHAEAVISQLLQKSLSKRLGNLKGGFQDIKEHPFCEGLDWEHPERLRVNTEPRPFDREAHEWLPGEVVLASNAPRQDADTQALFHGF
jgi:protein kinase X